MRYGVLGPLEVTDDGRRIGIAGAKQRVLLAILLVNANRVVSLDRLIDALWEEQVPDTAAKALQVHVSQLRKLLGPGRLATRSPGYLLRVDEGELDLHEFEALVRRAKDAPAAESAALLHQALALWRGPPLADFAFDRFAQAEIARLDELRIEALEERFEAELATGSHRALISELEAVVAEHPLRERLQGQLLLALYRSGRQAEALEAYQTARRALVEERGIELSRSLRELQQAILNQDPRLDLVAEPAPGADSTRGAFIGRERELGELLIGLDDAFAGRGRLFLLAGEPGIGKSRLADELIGRARARDAKVLVGRCWEAGGAPVYWPWVQSVRAYVRETDPETLLQQLGAGASDLARLLPELREFFPDLPEPPALESESARFRLFEAASTFLKSAARMRPLVLVLDDLHAADEPSLLLLRFLARELGESRLLVVGVYRDVDPSPTDPLTTALIELAREPVSRSLVLAGLSAPDVGRFVELISGEAPNEELAATIFEETEGNPLFVGEIVRLLAAEGRLGDIDAPRLVIPQSVRDVISRRLRHLSEECNRLLVLASVLGREFRLDALARLGGVSDELLDTLDEAMAARVVSDLPGASGHLRFAHVLIRDTLYEGLTAARRVRLHRLAVEALEPLYGQEPGPFLAELAHHSIAGSDFDRGLGYARRAGDRALALLAYEEAARLYAMALDALALSQPDDERTQCELLLSLGEAEIRAGNSPVAKATFLDAAGIARRLGLARELARAAAGYGGRIIFERAGSDDRLVPLLEEGLAALGDEEAELRVRLLARLAGALRDEPSRDRRDMLSREAVELARRTGNPAALAYALDGRLAAIVAPDVVDERITLASELRDAGDLSGERERVVAAHFHRFIARLEIGDVSAAQVDLTAATRIAEQLHQPAQLWQVTAAQAMLALADGRFDEAEKMAHRALALGETSIEVFAIPAFRMHMYALGTAQGKIDGLESMIRATVAEYPARPFMRCVLVHLYTALGRRAEARQEFEHLAKNGFAAVPFDIEWLYGTSLLAETCPLLGDNDSAAELYGLLFPYAGFNAVDVPEGTMGAVSRYLGLLASTLRRFEDAEHHFEEALEANERMGARPWLAHTQHDYAQMLVARGSAGDRQRAQQRLKQALTVYRELGMQPSTARASR
jgi:DNA-binding SARP family transcriptional activator/tetratricopeptide (TPR) repeat protein